MNAGLKIAPAGAKRIPLVPNFDPSGDVSDLVRPSAADIDFADMANAMSKIARFNGIYRCPAYSDAQHSVMGADALYNETGDAVLAGYFLLHDGHEYRLGDWTKPSVNALIHHARSLCAATSVTEGFQDFVDQVIRGAVAMSKATLDAVIYERAGIPPIDRMPVYQRQVKDMDDRMLRAEGLALFGQRAARHLPAASLPPPKLLGAIKPWGAMKAEEAFLDRLDRYLGIVVRPA